MGVCRYCTKAHQNCWAEFVSTVDDVVPLASGKIHEQNTSDLGNHLAKDYPGGGGVQPRETVASPEPRIQGVSTQKPAQKWDPGGQEGKYEKTKSKVDWLHSRIDLEWNSNIMKVSPGQVRVSGVAVAGYETTEIISKRGKSC